MEKISEDILKSRQSDIVFLEDFRILIDTYLIKGIAPSEDQGPFPDINISEYKKLMSQPKYIELRKSINEMKHRAQKLLYECRVPNQMVEYPAPAVGGPILKFDLFDLVVSNKCGQNVDKSEFLDRIDQAIGVLRNWKEKAPIKNEGRKLVVTNGFVFIAMPISDEHPELNDVMDSIKDVCREMGLTSERVDEPKDNSRITDRIIESLNSSEYVIADLTFSRQNVYYEAGYAHGIGKVPIYIARKDTKIEFDLKDYPIIFFGTNRELKEKLRSRLLALKNRK